MLIAQLWGSIRQSFASDYDVAALRTLIVVWSLVVIVVALNLRSKWLLAGLLAYEVLP